MKAARVYARLGWRVVPLNSVKPDGSCTCGKPCTSQGKHPRVNDWVNEASSDPTVVDAWIERWPDANVGIATGSASGFFCLDVDTDKGGEIPDDLPHTVQAVTGSGGAHFLFKLPDFEVTNSSNRVGTGLDIRGSGGQIVVAPSVSAKGAYRWVNAPWDTEIAEAPEWLVQKLGTSPQLPTERVSEEDRGYFPPATPAVLEQARDALGKHGPAIDGQGGGLHTVHAASILTHDFALTDDEAWPLFIEWNETCEPPWDLEGADSLRTMLGRGRRYGKLAYGCRRTMDPAEQARKCLRDWEAGPRDEPSILTMLQGVRAAAAQFTDPAITGLLLRDIKTATGLKDKEIALPRSRSAPVEIKQGEILMSPDLHDVANKSIAAIQPLVFARNGVLCEVVTNDRARIEDLQSARIQDMMSQCAKYIRPDEKKGTVVIAAPERVASILHARRKHPVRTLEAVTSAPIFLADGTILQEEGYNAQARVYLDPSVHVSVPDAPTLTDARQAVATFRDLLGDFHFLEEADFSSWVAALLSPLVKAATANAPTPLICISASSAGAGKSMLADIIARIVMGGPAEIRPYNPKSLDEWGKRLTSFVKAASPISVFDNVNGPIGDEGLDRLITSATWSDRLLGASEAPPLPNVTVWLATGNNIEPILDTVRRVLMVRVQVDVERPQERNDFKRPQLVAYAEQNRAEFLAHALTILRAYHLAGRPAQPLAAWGSFSVWSDLVRGALVWAGLADPFLTQRRAADQLGETEHEAHDFWMSVVPDSDGTATGIASLANQRDAMSVLGARESITSYTLRRFLGRFVDKPRGGRRIVRELDPIRGQTSYRVVRI